MAHILVYLQRTPLGLHPGSAVAACIARQVASERGAAVLGLCPGLSDAWDVAMERAAGRFGCDRLLFVGPREVVDLVERLRPVHVLVPWTTEGLAAAAGTGLGTPVPRIVDAPGPGDGPLDAVTAVAAGVLPWIDLPTRLEGEYTADAGMVGLPAWLAEPPPAPPPDFVPLAGSPFRVAVSGASSPRLGALAASLGAEAIDPAAAGPFDAGTLVWVERSPAPLPPVMDDRGARTSVVVVAPASSPHGRDDYRFADWVFRQEPEACLERLARPPWTTPSGSA